MRCLSFSILMVVATLAGACRPGPTTTPANGSTPAAAAASVGDTPFADTFAAADYPTPDTFVRGRLELSAGCLTFVNGTDRYRAVLPSGSRLSATMTDVIVGGGTSVALGRDVTIKGGEGDYGPPDRPPPACPRRAMLIGGFR